MPPAPPDPAGRFEQAISIAAAPEKVYDAFFSPEALSLWWQAVRSVTTPVPFGVYAVEWPATPYRDDLLGPLGGVFHGYQFVVADCWWVPPEGDPIGPMALQITCQAEPGGCKLVVRQDGYEPAPRWRRYYVIVSREWQISLAALKRYLEQGTIGPLSH